jgi:hypothetical protein
MMGQQEPMRSSSRFAFLFALACAASACGGNQFTLAGTEDAGGDGGTLTADQACGDNASARCQKIATCSSELMTTTYGDEGTCAAQLKLNCLNGMSAPSAGGTPQTTEACAQAFATWSCDDYLNDNPPAACVQVKGTAATGQPCGFAGQCQTGFCAIVPGNACGTCAPVPQAGASCASLTTCGQLSACQTTTTEQCATFAPAGASCGRGLPCGAGLYCVGSTATTTGSCEPAVEQVGASCDPLGKAGPGCDRLAGLTCNSVSRECATIVYAATGQACGTVNDQTALCASAGTCAPAAGMDASAGETCSPTATNGAACDLVLGPFCRDPMRCIVSGEGGTQGTCQLQSATCH